ncbi:MAG: DUF3368 domain-containing protein [Verrucomicrobia bacterium]|nr:DUF3368 domain-containing protein [Verrucomicrobiota bacterium]
MIVVSDTSPLTSLITIGREHLLERLFGAVYVPEAVQQELISFHGALPSFLRTASVQHRGRVLQLEGELDRGEAEAIVLAQELMADLILIDEKTGRRVAIREGLNVIGLLGVVTLAKRRGLIPSAREVVDSLRLHAGFHIADDVVAAALRSVGEP